MGGANEVTDESINEKEVDWSVTRSKHFQMHSCVFQVFEVTGSLSRHSVSSPTHEECMKGMLLILSGASAHPRGLAQHPLPIENFRMGRR